MVQKCLLNMAYDKQFFGECMDDWAKELGEEEKDLLLARFVLLLAD